VDQSAGGLTDRCFAESIVVEVMHRPVRRLFGLAGLAPVRDEVAPTPVAGTRPQARAAAAGAAAAGRPRCAAGDRLGAALKAAIAHCTKTIRSTKHTLDRLARGDVPAAEGDLISLSQALKDQAP
jgi:hypothetical protein